MTEANRIAFIGGGNMATSLVGGLVAGGHPPTAIVVAEPREGARKALQQRFRVGTTADNAEAVQGADAVVLAVKPQVLEEVATALAGALGERPGPVVISIAAGLRSDDIERWLGGERPVVRAMPNTPALLGAGASALYANARVDRRQQGIAAGILESAGIVVWLDDEARMNVVTALSGSGPAYFFLVMEAMQNAATECGLAPDTARRLCQQTALGAARMAIESGEDVSTLRERVTSPGGTTERGIEALESAGLRDAFREAIAAAAARAGELAETLGGGGPQT
ncbi:MAG TPA: pyrroline-5-carboxylate reductase [Gammaproteobacteria bacterium]|nr:pyrroline-5-carboxylate reductase [Gammaproteobacteria bacterium]